MMRRGGFGEVHECRPIAKPHSPATRPRQPPPHRQRARQASGRRLDRLAPSPRDTDPRRTTRGGLYRDSHLAQPLPPCSQPRNYLLATVPPELPLRQEGNGRLAGGDAASCGRQAR